MNRNSVGLVKEQTFSFGSAEEPLQLESGNVLAPVEIVYETYGEPNKDRSNSDFVAPCAFRRCACGRLSSSER